MQLGFTPDEVEVIVCCRTPGAAGQKIANTMKVKVHSGYGRMLVDEQRRVRVIDDELASKFEERHGRGPQTRSEQEDIMYPVGQGAIEFIPDYGRNVKKYRIEPVGYWSEKYENGVTPMFLTGEIDPFMKSQIVHYLKSGHRGIEFLGRARCRFHCKKSYSSELENTDFTDGSWVWPEGLAHYVEEHNLLLPPEFILHMHNNRFSVPQVDVDFMANHKMQDNAPEIQVESENIWKNWLLKNNEQAYLKNPVVIQNQPQHTAEQNILDEWLK